MRMGDIMKHIIELLVNCIFRLFKINKNKIVFEAGRGMVDGNVKAVYDYMIENNIDQFKLIWLVNKDTDVSNLRMGDYAYYKTLKGYFHLATAHYWLKNESVGSLIKKRKGQIYIQLFHGNGAMKKMGYDVDNAKDRIELEHVKDWDYYIANDVNDKNIIISSTGYKGEIVILGSACIDNVIKMSKDKKHKEKILNELGIKDKNKKIILYAPTFRDFDLDKDIVDVPILKLSKLKDYIVVVRLHPLVRSKVNKDLFKYNNIINGCNYPDCSDILAISDLLITDYSSIFYEFLPLNLPIVFYPYDYSKYIELRGGFYVDYEKELPGPICYNEKDLLNTINNIEKISKEYLDKRKKFIKKYASLSDGKSSQRFVDKLISGYFSKERE